MCLHHGITANSRATRLPNYGLRQVTCTARGYYFTVSSASATADIAVGRFTDGDH